MYDLLEKPFFKLSNKLNDRDLKKALRKITGLLAKKQIVVDFAASYDSRTRYRFITEELFEEQTDDFIVPGMIRHFTYEEFHPNHKLDIENRTMEFLSHWFDRSFDEHSWELSDAFILPDGKILSKAEVSKKLKTVLDCYTDFTDCKYSIDDIRFELNNDTGMGHAEGTVKFNAILENHEVKSFEGPFKLYLSLDTEWWSIFYFVFPGFEF